VDGNALTLERLARVPESVNSNTETKVKYTVNFGSDGEPISYTLLQLARLFSVPETPALPTPPIFTPPAMPRTPTALQSRKGSSGQRALRLRRLRDLDILMELRGGRFKDGCRNHAATLLGALQRGNPFRNTIVQNFCRDRCAPALHPCEVRAVLKAFHNRRFKITDLKLGEWLKVTPSEAQYLDGGDKYLTPRVSPTVTAPTTRRRRREIISEMYASGRPPTIHQIVERLRDDGVIAGVGTVWNDIKALGLSNYRAHREPLANLSLFPIENLSMEPREKRAPIYVEN
jgi:hypothetical protein